MTQHIMSRHIVSTEALQQLSPRDQIAIAVVASRLNVYDSDMTAIKAMIDALHGKRDTWRTIPKDKRKLLMRATIERHNITLVLLSEPNNVYDIQ